MNDMTDIDIVDLPPNVSARANGAANVLTPSRVALADATRDELIKEADRLDADYAFDEADEIIRETIASFPEDASIVAKYVKMALQRGDWHGALDRAKEMRRRFPDEAAGYSGALDALRELRRIDEANALAQEAAGKFANDLWPLRNAALLAETCEDMNAAEAIWDALSDKFPDSADVMLQNAGFYRRCGRLERADELLRSATDRFPSDASLHVAFAQVAGEALDWPEAERRWHAARARFPNNATIALQQALLPVGTPVWKKKNFDEALARLEQVQQRFPEFGPAQEARVRLLRVRGKHDEAAAAAEMLTRQLPHYAGTWLEYARVLASQGKRGQAIACLADLIERLPNTVQAYVDLAAALSRDGQRDEAETVCRRAISRFRFHRGPLIEYANIAVHREAWQEALNRWREALRLLPSEPEIRKGIAATRLALAAAGDANGDDAPLEIPPDEDQGSLADLLMKFESLGAPAWGCEFGFVQRKFGAEPISLLRWAGINTLRLIEALECRFEGVGEPQQTKLHAPADLRMDYHTRDTRFGVELHTFVHRGQMSEEKVLEQCCLRIRYLKKKLIEDLESGGKIFIFRPGDPIPTQEQVDRLYAAMRSYGNNTLLYVICGDEIHRPGTVEIVKPGLMIGYFSKLSWSPETGVGTPDFAGWIRICSEAYRLRGASNAVVENA